MRLKVCLALLVLLPCAVTAQPPMLWEAGRLDYINGAAEVAAFVNTTHSSQLQLVLCSRSEPNNFRFTLLLPASIRGSRIIETVITADERVSSAFAELQGNAHEFQLDEAILVNLRDTAALQIKFTPDAALDLGLPEVLDIPMRGADFVLRRVAAECTALTLDNDFEANRSMVSAMLWPAEGFNRLPADRDNVDRLCTTERGSALRLNLSPACKLTLDRFYAREGLGALSFLHRALNGNNGWFARYRELWNQALELLPSSPMGQEVYAQDQDWYVLLYALAGSQKISELPKSYFDVLESTEDPTTLLYDIENRYEMEMLKYASVLMRRINTSLSARNHIEQALRAWTDFYREFSQMIPPNKRAQALRPLIYRQMLLRIWRMAGMPRGIHLDPEHTFIQGTNGRTSGSDLLEAKCSVFEGQRGDQFFYPSRDCTRGIELELRSLGFINEDYQRMMLAWEQFANHWNDSIFEEELPNEQLNSGLALTLLSLAKNYGFGDYFLLRECLSSRDSDVCAFEVMRSENTYKTELHNKIEAISAVSARDAETLNQLSTEWSAYLEALNDYMDALVRRGRLEQWRAEFVRGVAVTAQTDLLINALYYRETFSDEDVIGDEGEDDFDIDFDAGAAALGSSEAGVKP